MVIAGIKPGESKLTAAKKNGIPILDESALRTLLEGKMISAAPVSVSETPGVTPSAPVTKSSEPESSAPDDLTGGLTKAQLTRFRKLLESDEYGAWEYFHEKRTNSEVEDQRAAARLNLWLARSGYAFCLGEIVWAKHYSLDENLEVLKGHSPPTEERNEEIFAYWHWHSDLAKQRPEQLKALVQSHTKDLPSTDVVTTRNTLSWSEHRRIGFKLLLWLTDTREALDLSVREQRVLARKLARQHIWNPKIPVSRVVPVRPNVPLTPRDFALTVLPKHVWVDALMQLEDDAGTFGQPGFEEHGRFSRVVDIFSGMPLSDVERFIPDYDAEAFPDDLTAMASLFQAKDLSVSELVRVASGIAAKRAASQHVVPSRLVDILCLLAAQKDIDAPIDGLVTFAIRHEPWVGQYRSWLAAIGPTRRSAVEERAQASEPSACFSPEFEEHSGWDPDALNDTRAQAVLSRLQDPRLSDAGAYGREATMALFTLPPTHPVIRLILERMLSLKVWMYSLFEYVLPFHPNPSLLLQVIAEVHQHTTDRTADRTEDLKQLRTFIQNANIQVTAKFTGDWAEHFGQLDVQAAPSDAHVASGKNSKRVRDIESLQKLAAVFDGPKIPIYAMEVGTDLGPVPAEGPFAKGPFLGDNPKAETDTVILTIPFVDVPELAQRYPQHDHLSILIPSNGGWDFEAGYVVSFVATKKRTGRACPVTLHRVEVPSDVFVTALRKDEDGEDIAGPLEDLYEALWSLDGYLLGDGLFGEYNNRYYDVESEGPDPKFIACLHHQEEKLFVYSDQVMWIR